LGTFLDLGPTLTASGIKEVLRPFYREPPPLIILDVPRQESLSESVRQLLLRNTLASELHQYGPARAILGTGLGTAADQDRLYRALAQSLARSPTPGEVHQAIRHLALTPVLPRMRWRPFSPYLLRLFNWLLPGLWPQFLESNRLEKLLPFGGTALFTDDPAVPILAVPHSASTQGGRP
jgi:hypothetical protein